MQKLPYLPSWPNKWNKSAESSKELHDSMAHMSGSHPSTGREQHPLPQLTSDLSLGITEALRSEPFGWCCSWCGSRHPPITFKSDQKAGLRENSKNGKSAWRCQEQKCWTSSQLRPLCQMNGFHGICLLKRAGICDSWQCRCIMYCCFSIKGDCLMAPALQFQTCFQVKQSPRKTSPSPSWTQLWPGW